MLTRPTSSALAALVVSAATCGVVSLAVAAPVAADDPPVIGGHPDPSPHGTASGHAHGDGSLEVTVESSYSAPGTSGKPTTTSTWVQPQCYLRMGKTGYDYYEYWKDGSDALDADTLSDFKYQGLLNKGWDDPKIATDKEGHWYDPFCNFGVDPAVSDTYYRTIESKFVEPGDPVPTAQATVDPETLLEAMRTVMKLPEGTVGRNPELRGSGATLVGAPTWVWVDAPPLTMSASIASGARADLVANLTSIFVTGDDATSARCDDPGTPWTPAAEKSVADPCAITFNRSSAGRPGSTTTMEVTARWTATWTTNLEPGTRTVDPPPPPVTLTEQVPVAESESIATS